MGVSNRASKISSVVAAICIIAYILAIAYAAVQIYENIRDHGNLASREFYDLRDLAVSSAVVQHFMGQEYRETIQDYIDNSKTILGVIITGSNGAFAFEKYRGSGIVWAGDSPRIRISPNLFNIHRPISIEGQRDGNIQAVFSRIDSDVVLTALKDSFLVVLSALAIAFITLLIELSLKKKTVSAEAGFQVKTKTEEPDSLEETEKGVAVKYDMPDGLEEKDSPSIEEPVPENEMEISFLDFLDAKVPGTGTEEEGVDEEQAVEEEQVDGPVIETVIIQDMENYSESHEEEEFNNPQGLFSPRSNVGWESYTLDRLKSELHRCASFEQDLVFMIMEFKNPGKLVEAQYRQFAAEAISFFSMRDLIFEKGETGLSIIIPSIDLEQGIIKAREFRNRVHAKLTTLFENPGEDQSTELCIGLSSRSGRLTEAERLMLEASKALEKALEDPDSPIMAFKSDPEKYRDYIKKRY